MSDSETLRAASARIRVELLYGGSGHPFYEAIADWLDAVADDREKTRAFPMYFSHAIRVAEAYVGESPA